MACKTRPSSLTNCVMAKRAKQSKFSGLKPVLIFFGGKNCLDFDRLSECHPQKENMWVTLSKCIQSKKNDCFQ